SGRGSRPFFRIIGAAVGERFCHSLGDAAYFLHSSDRLYVAMAGPIHRGLSSALARDGANRSKLRRQSTRRLGQRRKESKFADDNAARARNYCGEDRLEL